MLMAPIGNSTFWTLKETLWDRQAYQAKFNEKFQILKTNCRP